METSLNTTSKERPILFNAEMVRAILDGRKSQTRRVMKVQPSANFSPINLNFELDYNAHWYTPGVVDKDGYLQPAKHDVFGVASEDEGYTSPLGHPGDRLWVRETWACRQRGDCCTEIEYAADNSLAKFAPNNKQFWEAKQVLAEGKFRPSIHMPRFASRIDLLITGIRVERVQDISEEDAHSEGFEHQDGWSPSYSNPDNGGFDEPYIPARFMFAETWRSIYGADSWNANPWIWKIEFERLAKDGE